MQSILDEEQKWADDTNAKIALYRSFIFGIIIINILIVIFFLSKIKKYIKNGKELEKELGQDENTNPTEETEQKTANTKEVTTDVSTQVVTAHPIAEKYNKEYNGIKIKNETSYELTDEILNPNNLDIRKDNVTIFHTHTCESYTQSENYKYTPSRKLQNNRFKLFSCKGRG